MARDGLTCSIHAAPRSIFRSQTFLLETGLERKGVLYYIGHKPHRPLRKSIGLSVTNHIDHNHISVATLNKFITYNYQFATCPIGYVIVSHCVSCSLYLSALVSMQGLLKFKTETSIFQSQMRPRPSNSGSSTGGIIGL